jgi:predicted ATPase
MSEEIKYIKRVEISKLWNKFDIEWDLHPNVNILAGGNGSGKSTILDCILSLLVTGKVYDKYNNIAQSIKICFDNDTFIKFTDKLEGNIGISEVSVFCGIISTFEQEFVPFEAIRHLVHNNPNIRSTLDLYIVDLQTKYLNYKLDISKKKDELTDKLANPKEAIIKLRQSQNRFLDILDELFSETGKKVNRDSNEISFILDTKTISPYVLSSGEKQLLIILLKTLILDNKQTILFMDEPEVSLHIDWQQKLIGYIRELNPNVQLIIATHSPAIIMNGWLDKVFNVNDITVKNYQTAK